MPPALQRLDHVHVFVRDRPAAELWYAQALGFRRIAELEFWAVDGGPLTLADPSSSIHLALFEGPALACRSTLAFAVGPADFLAWRSHLFAVLGSPVQAEDHEVSWSLYFDDPDGNPYEITCYDHAVLAPELARGKAPLDAGRRDDPTANP